MALSLLNRVFRTYGRLVHNRLFYRSVEIMGRENLPSDDEGLIVVANHQNALGDPLLLENCFGQHKVTIFAMGAAMNMPVFGAFLRWLNLLPAYRMRTDGEESLSRNAAEFDEAGRRLMEGQYVAIFPEATNQTRRWLGDFSEGYLRMAFETAESAGFARDIKVLPCAIHYSNWFAMQSDVLIRMGKPISLQPYYELYKTKPRTARRTVNAIVRRSVQSMMLDVRDDEHYEAIDYVLERERRLANKPLSARLERERQLTVRMAKLAQDDPELFDNNCNEILNLKAETRDSGLRDWLFDVSIGWGRVIAMWLLMLLALPVFLFSLIPNLLVFLAPEPLVSRISKIGEKYVLFASGIRYAVSMLVTIPLLWTATLLVEGFCLTWWLAVPHLLLQPLLLLFGWRYMKLFRQLTGATRMLCHKDEIQPLVEKRNTLIKYIYG